MIDHRVGVPALALALACIGCAGAVEVPGPGLPEPERAGVPGFDTREYPGDDAMRRWREASPYRWVGYYLPAPCHTGTGWVGKRRTLAAMDWGIAVLFVGEQDWAAAGVERPTELPGAAGDTTGPGAAGADTAGAEVAAGEAVAPRCTRSNLTAARGAADAVSADSSVAAEGFPRGTVIYLDVERVSTVSPELSRYVAAWTARVLDGGYVPGLYVHAANADDLLPVMAEEFARRGRSDVPPLWVAKSGDFDLRRAPGDSGFPAARIWQGLFDVRETWGGVTLRIDANVANTESPS